jgi:hypothetical protein
MKHLSLLQLRGKQLKRQLAQPGFFYGTLLVIFVMLVIGVVWQQFHDPVKSKIMAGLIVLLILSIHIARKDKFFVQHQLPAPDKQFFYEYSFLSLPLTLPCLFTMQWYLMPCMLACFYIVARLRISLRQRTAFPQLSRMIPPTQFELLSGFRKNYVLIIVLYLAAWATSWLLIAPVFILWLMTIAVMGWYTECESYDMLTVAHRSPAVFLRKKIRAHYRLLALITLPILLVNVVLHPAYCWIALFLVLVQPVLITLGIAYKYSHYEPKETFSTGHVLLSIISLSSLVPFLLPMPLFFAFRYYRRAINHLQYYLYDQHSQP